MPNPSKSAEDLVYCMNEPFRIFIDERTIQNRIAELGAEIFSAAGVET